MILKGIIDEDFVNYKKPSMTLMFPHCTFKCGAELCQNSPLVSQEEYHIDSYDICKRYLLNDITEAIVCQGLEPFDSWFDLQEFIIAIRIHYYCFDDIVIYTGYEENEISDKIEYLSSFSNIIIKFGRYIPNQEKHFDEVLGVYLASDNQYAKALNTWRPKNEIFHYKKI